MSSNKHKMAPPAGGAVVRMYCTGLGDCFLLGFPKKGGSISHMLIDCGVLQGTKDVKPWMRKIVANIVETVGDQGIEILAVTHKHWDHLSGFHQASAEFKKLDVKRVWMGWTEDPDDPGAKELASQERIALRAIRAAATQMRAAGEDIAEGIRSLLEFEFGMDDDPLVGARKSSNDLMNMARELVETPTYLKPGLKPLHPPGAADVNIYVLGPPTDMKLFRKSDPSSGSASEVYIGNMPVGEMSALFAGAELNMANQRSLDDDERRLREFSFPFEWQYGIPTKDAFKKDEHREFFRNAYGHGRRGGSSWRRIDTSWLGVAENLALLFDRHRNNTSLSLAIELGEGGPVMIFPGDAQVGNWLFWHKLKGSPSAADLLKRTTLYKVGHHASHNATLKSKGLGLMSRKSKLVAMIPVDEDKAHEPKGRNKSGWNMPYPELLEELERRTESRLLRADHGIPLLKKRTRPSGWSKSKWDRFRKAAKVFTDAKAKKPLYVQYVVK